MDAYDLVKMLHGVYDLCDDLDREGYGVYAITNGEHTSRDALKLELGHFLAWIGGANGTYSEGEMALINFVLGTDWDAQRLKQFSTGVEPNPNTSASLGGFLLKDKAMNADEGTRKADGAELVISLFDAMAEVVIAFDDNATAKAKKNKYINGMKTYVQKNL